MNATRRVGRFFQQNKDSGLDILVLFVVVQVLSVAYALISPETFHYLSEANISVMLKAIPVLGVLALGVGVLMISGEFDLSVGAVYTLTGIFIAKQVEGGMSPFIAAPLGLGLGALMGLMNGFITIRFNIPSFITTLGTMLFWQGMTLLYHGANAMRFRPDEVFANLMAGNIGIMQSSFIWYLLLTLGFGALLHYHKLGNHFFAVGGNKRAATAIGIRPNRVKMLAFALTGFCAAFAAILAASRVGAIQPGQGSGLELQAIAACVIGGVALSGGRGSILGIFLGAALIHVIQDILLLLRAPGFYLDIFVGVLIVGAAIFNEMVRRQSSHDD